MKYDPEETKKLVEAKDEKFFTLFLFSTYTNDDDEEETQ